MDIKMVEGGYITTEYISGRDRKQPPERNVFYSGGTVSLAPGEQIALMDFKLGVQKPYAALRGMVRPEVAKIRLYVLPGAKLPKASKKK